MSPVKDLSTEEVRQACAFDFTMKGRSQTLEKDDHVL